MPFSFTETPDSRQSTLVPPAVTLKFRASGEQDDASVMAYATAFTPALVSHSSGAILYRQDVAVEPAGFKLYKVSVPYSVDKHDTGSFKLSFDTTGGTLHITASKETIQAYGSGATTADYKQAIGVTGKEDVEGADVIIPVLKITATFRHPQGVITIPQIKNLGRWTGKVNSDTFLTFDPGEVLFLGATGDEGTDQPTEIAYHFACSENLTGLSIGGITGIDKKGHHLYWIKYKKNAANNKGVIQPESIYIERVYDVLPLASCLGFGG